MAKNIIKSPTLHKKAMSDMIFEKISVYPFRNNDKEIQIYGKEKLDQIKHVMPQSFNAKAGSITPSKRDLSNISPRTEGYGIFQANDKKFARNILNSNRKVIVCPSCN